MRPISLIIEVEDKLDKITLLKSLLYPLDEFFKLTSIWKLTKAKNPLWTGLKIDQDEREIILIDGQEHFITDIYTEVTFDCYLEFNDVIDFLADQFRKKCLYAQFFGSVLIDIPKIGAKRVFREIQEVEWYYPETSTSSFRGSVLHKALFPPLWIWIEELSYGYDVWIHLASHLWFPELPGKVVSSPVDVGANFERLCGYLNRFFEKHLPYCRDFMIDPDEVPENVKIAEALKPIFQKMLTWKSDEIEILL